MQTGTVKKLEVDDVIPAFLAKKLELCRKLGEVPASPTSAEPMRATTPKSAQGDLRALRKKDSFLKQLFNDNKLNHRQKEQIAANILIGKSDMDSRPPIFVQKKSSSVSPLKTGNIISDGQRRRHQHKHRSVELVGNPINIKVAAAKDVRREDVCRKHNNKASFGGYTWADEYLEANPPQKISAQRSFEGVSPSPNREFIVDAIARHNSVKAKRSADQVRELKNVALQEKSMFGNDTLQEVAVKKKINKFRRNLHIYLTTKGERQRGDIMRCIDEETIYTFMENFKGYSMSVDVILSLLGTTLGSGQSEGVLIPADDKAGYLPVQSSHQDLQPHLRELRAFSPEETVSQQGEVSQSGRTSPLKPISRTVNGFKVVPRPNSRRGAGFIVSQDTIGISRDFNKINSNMAVSGTSVNGMGSALQRTNNDKAKEQTSSTWVTELERSSSAVGVTNMPSSYTKDGPSSAPLISIPDPKEVSTRGDSTAPPDLCTAMRHHMASTNTLPSLFPEKVLTDEELLGIGNGTMSFEEIAKKRERAAILARKAKKPVTGLAGLRSGKSTSSVEVDIEKTHIPRFINTPKSGGEDFFPKSPNPVSVPIDYFS